MNERKLQHGSRINAADQDTLECSVGPNIFEGLNDGLVDETITPSAAARSAAFAPRIDTGKVRDILLGRFGRSPHRHPLASGRSDPASLEGPLGEFLLASLG